MRLAFCLARLISYAHFGDKLMKLRFVVCASCSSNGSDARFVLKTVVVCINKMVVLPSRFLSPEGIAECERACNKEKPSLQELSKAALNVSIGKRVE